MLLLNVDHFVLYESVLVDAQKLMSALEESCTYTKWSANRFKTDIMFVKSKNKDKLIEIMENFKNLGLITPSNQYTWNECVTRHLETRKRAYYVFENTCNREKINCWVLKKYLFDTSVTPLFL